MTTRFCGSPCAAIVLSWVLFAATGCSSPSPEEPADTTVDGLQYVSPEEVGWSSQKLETSRNLARQAGYAAVPGSTPAMSSRCSSSGRS